MGASQMTTRILLMILIARGQSTTYYIFNEGLVIGLNSTKLPSKQTTFVSEIVTWYSSPP